MSYVLASTSNPLGRRPWASRLQGLGEIVQSDFQIPMLRQKFPHGSKEYRQGDFLLPTITRFAGGGTGYENAVFIVPTTNGTLGQDASEDSTTPPAPTLITPSGILPSSVSMDPMWLLIGAGILIFLSFGGGLKTAPALQAHKRKRVSRKRAKLQRQLKALSA